MHSDVHAFLLAVEIAQSIKNPATLLWPDCEAAVWRFKTIE
jgi:hypothetical protein